MSLPSLPRSLPSPLQSVSRSTLLLWAAGVCAAIALVLAVSTHGSDAQSGKQPPEVRHGWVRGLFANNELHRGGR